MEDSIERQIKELGERMVGSAELLRRFKQFERDIRQRDSIWEARLRYARRGLEVTNRELALTNSKLARANTELSELRNELEKRVQERTQELKVERDRIELIIAQLSAGLLLIDKIGKISLINAQAEAFLGIKKEEVLGYTARERSDASRQGKFFQFLDTVEPNVKKRFEFAEPEVLVLEVVKTNLVHEKEVVGSLVLLHDITREAVVERVKSEFVALTAHQLRTPLSVIKWVFALALEEKGEPLTPTIRQLLEKGNTSNERMIKLVNDLLDVVRIEEGRFGYKFVDGSVSEVLEDALGDIKISAAQNDITISFSKPKRPLPKVSLDFGRLRVAVLNILENAVKYTPRGGRMSIKIQQKRDKILITVQDTGIGIPSSQHARLFTKFFRAANAVRMRTEGNGLGLFIAKNIIEKHGGKIWVESQENKGTTVYFTIPTAK